jgi:hypothetical protein
MTDSWTSKSRYGDLRHFTYDENKQEIRMKCDRVLYVSYSDGKDKEIRSVDPDGGPYLGVGGTITREPSGPTYRILRILSCSQPGKGLEVTVAVSDGDGDKQ